MLYHPSHSLLLLAFMFVVRPNLPAQAPADSTRQWVLQFKNESATRSEVFYQVANSIAALNSTDRCKTLEVLEAEGSARPSYRFQLLRLQVFLASISRFCPDRKPDEEIINLGLREAFETRDPVLIAEMNREVMSYFVRKNDYGSAGVYGLVAKEYEERAGLNHFTNTASLRFYLGFCSFHSRDYPMAIKANLEALHLSSQPGTDPTDTLDPLSQINAWNTIGLSYSKLGSYDSAFHAFRHALHINERINNPFWRGLVEGNMGDIYFRRGQYDSARILLLRDVEASRAAGQWDNAANSLQWIARINAQEGDAHFALDQNRQATIWLKQAYKAEFQENLYYTYIQVFKTLRQPDSMDLYMNKYLLLHDSLEAVATKARDDIVRMRMDNQKFIYEILTLNQEKQKITLIRNLIVFIILLAAATGYLLFHRSWLKMKWRQQKTLFEKEKAEQEATAAREQLALYTEFLGEKTKQVDDLEDRLLQQRLLPDTNGDSADLEQITLLTDEDWEQFRMLFERVHPGFFRALQNMAPDITVAEQRMAALIKLQIPAKKAASILAISPNSVHKSRQRLRKRLGLENDNALDTFFASALN
jgi:tetratricopeptide (TPR) repeat protein